MPSSPFADLRADFERIVAQTVFCSATTVDEHGRPRSRMLHPIFTVEDGLPLGWALTGRTPLKTRHLALNPYVSCTYWTPSHDTVIVDCDASWVEDTREKQAVWDLFLTTPTPLGWGADGLAGYGPQRWASLVFSPLRLDPWRVQVMRGSEYPRGTLTGGVWHRPSG